VIVKLDGAEEVAVIGHGDGRHFLLGDDFHELRDLAGSIEQRVIGVAVKMNERVRHYDINPGETFSIAGVAAYTGDVATKFRSEAKKPVARKRVPGIDTGKIWMAEDFDVLSESELAEWYEVTEALLEGRGPLSSSQVRKKLGLDS
jgi:hypothetical protein